VSSGAVRDVGVTGADRLAATVVAGGYCIGCGACASLEGSPFRIRMSGAGQFEAALEGTGDVSMVTSVCPFSDGSESEAEIAGGLFGAGSEHSRHIGFHRAIRAGHVAEGDFRANGSSGGFGTWIAHELLRANLVDAIVSVGESGRSDVLFAYGVAWDAAGVLQHSKSRYYPVEMSGVLKAVRENDARYAVVGLPCFIKAIRLLQARDPLLRERIHYTIGLVCGHLKSRGFAESMAWQAGVNPAALRAINFRVKLPGRKASDYGITVSDGCASRTVPARELVGQDWGAGAFKYKACDFCDDVFAETADIAFGDAWLPRYEADHLGTNIVVVRNAILERLVDGACREGRLVLDHLSPEDAVRSQGGGVRHRRDALSLRLALEMRSGRWVPRKRLPPRRWSFAPYEVRLQRGRIALRELSKDAHALAMRKGDLSVFLEPFKARYEQYRQISGTLFERALALARRRLNGVP
jgi:coenzyme F420 hydrogenase subunit beta